MSCRVRRYGGVFLVLALCVVPWSLGSGFHIFEQGAKASGRACAFVAGADDASALYYNPAAMAWLDGGEISLGSSLVLLGDTTLDSQMDLTGSPLFTGGRFEMESNSVHVPHGFAVKGAGDGRVAYGIGVFAPFGLITEWGPGFDGRFSARKSELESYVINPNVAFRASDKWAFGFGLDMIRLELKHFSRNLPPTETTPIEGLFDLRGEGDEVGWNLALSYRNEGWRFGASYRSGFEVEVEGEATVAYPLLMPGQPQGPFAPDEPPTQRLVQRARGTIDLPETWAVGIAYTGLPAWELEFDIHKINWSSFEELPIVLDYGLEVAPGVLVQEIVAEEDWLDTTSFRFGASRELGETSELRFGIYWEDRAIPTRTLRPSVPDAERTGLTFGWGWSPMEGVTVDGYWMHIETAGVETTLQEFMADNSVIAGAYETTIDLFGVTVSFAL